MISPIEKPDRFPAVPAPAPAPGPPAAAHRARRSARAAHWRGASCPHTSGV